MIDHRAVIVPSFGSVDEVPEWLTLENLEKAEVVEVWGYRQMWADRQWGLECAELSYLPHQPEYGAGKAAYDWQTHICEQKGRSFPDNHQTALIRVEGNLIYVMFHDGLVFFGLTARPGSW